MTGSDSPVPVDSLSDPESLLDHPDIAVETRTEPIDAADFEDAEAWTDHVVVGVADDRGVLLYDDGHHGWTPPAFEVPDDEDALAVADREFEALTGTPLSIAGVLHARRRTFTVADDGDDRETAVWNVLLQATPDTRLPDDPESEAEDAALAWRDGAPDDAPAVVATDVERIAATAQAAAPDPTESLTDPDALRDRDGVPFTDETQTVPDDEFERRDAWEGVAVVGATDADGALLLAELGDGHGWMLPNGPVEPGEDFVAAAGHWTEVMTGATVAVDGVERVHRKRYRAEDGRETTSHHVVFAASPVDGTAVAEDPGHPSQDIETVGWFTEVPPDADWDHDDFGEDVRRFLDAGE